MDIIFFLVAVLIIISIYMATFLFWYWAFFMGEEETRSRDRYKWVSFGSLIGVGIFFYGGFKGILFFLPSSLGDFRDYLLITLAFVATAYIHSRPFKLVDFFKRKEKKL